MHLKRKLSDYSRRDVLTVLLPVLLCILVGFWLASRFIKPAPPAYMVITTGSAGGAYQYYAAHYKTFLARNGIELRELPSEGSVENLRRLKDPKIEVDVGLVQGGTGAGMDPQGLVSLGSFAPEPVWLFYRSPATLDKLTELRGMRVAVGPEGSGVRKLALDLLYANGIEEGAARLLPLGGLGAVAALNKGEVDAVFVVGAARSAAVWTLLFSDGVKLMSFSQADAYVRRFPYLSQVTLPVGGIDLARNIPSRDVAMVAATATLVAREDAHPALVSLLMQAAAEAHREPGLFQKPNEYPKAVPVDFPLSKDADRYFKSGPPLLQRYLPFWAATLVDRTMVMLIPLLALLLPLIKVAPGIYTWRVRSRLIRYYGELKYLETEIVADYGARAPAEWKAELERLEALVRELNMPKAFMDQLYTLRSHIELVRDLLKRKAEEAKSAAS